MSTGRSDLIVRADGDFTGLDRAWKSASASAKVFERELARVERSQRASYKMQAQAEGEMAAEMTRRSRERQAALQQMSRGAMIAGAAVVAGLGLATKAAIDWESAWAGVNKTVNGSPAQMAALETQLRGLAQVLPATHAEIAGVAEAAGQLGVARQDITGFTHTMIDLGETTNLSADEAATAIAQMANVMGTRISDVDRFGATLVALGNAGASTESEILAMAQRLSGAGKLIGASEADVLGLSNAMASMGIEAELGGGAMSRTILKIYAAVQQGGPAVEKFGQIAGMSGQEFTRAFGEDPVRAIDAFIQGLNRIDQSGGNVIGTLDDVGITGTQNLQVLLRLKGAGDLLTDSLDLGAKAWQQNSALATEAGKRYQTAESRIQVARNQINDAAIDIGGALAPAVAGAATTVGDLATQFGRLPGPVKTGLTALTAFAGGGLLTLGAIGAAVPKIQAARDSLRGLGNAGQLADKQLGRIGRAGGRAGGYAAAFVAIAIAAHEADKAIRGLAGDVTPNSERMTNALAHLGEQGKATGELTRIFGDDLGRLDEDLGRLSSGGIDGFRRKWGGLGDSLGITHSEFEDAREDVRGIDEGLAELVSGGHADTAAAALQALGITARDLKDALGGTSAYADALADADTDALLAGDAADSLGGSLAELGDQGAGAAEDLETYADALDRVNGINITAFQAQVALARATRDLSEAADKHTKVTLNEKDELASFARQANDTAAAVFNDTENRKKANRVLRDSRKDFIAAAIAMGYSSTEAKKLADELLGIPEHTKAVVETPGLRAAIANSEGLKQILDDIPGNYTATVTIATVGQIPSGVSVRQLSDGDDRHAAGGYITGPGSGTSDSVPAMLSNGEYVLRASAVDKLGIGFLDRINRFAGGGLVGGKVTKSEAGDYASWIDSGRFVSDLTGTPSEVADAFERIQRLGGSVAATARAAEKNMLALAKSGDTLTKSLEKAKARLKDLRDARAQLAGSIADGVSSYGDVTSLEEGRAATVASITQSMTARAEAAKKFQAQLDALEERGLRKTLVRQIGEAGVEGGGATAAALTQATDAQLHRINKLGGNISRTGAALGELVAGDSYDGPIKAARRVVAGLHKGGDAIRDEMLAIARKLRVEVRGAIGDSRQRKAAGGWVTGGVRGQDSVPALLMPDEFVVRAGAAQAHAGLLELINTGRVPTFATGGWVRGTRIAPAGPCRASLLAGAAAGSSTASAVRGGDSMEVKIYESRRPRETARQVIEAQRAERYLRTGRWG